MGYKIPEIIVNGKAYAVEEILKEDNIISDAFTKEIFEFFREWHSQKDMFTLYTSGSTGEPRPIRITRAQMVYSAHQTIGFFNLKENDILLLCLSPGFIGGKMMLVRAFVNNMKIMAVEPSSNPLKAISLSQHIDFMAVSPHQLYSMLTEEREKIKLLNQMKAVIVGGAPMDPRLVESVRKLQVPVYSTYGMTETVSHVALQRINGPASVGFFEAIGDVTFGLDERGCLTVIGTVTNGQLWVTNDLVELLGPKRFRWIGRFDNVINSGGIKIMIEELESKIGKILSAHGMYSRFFIFPQPDPAFGQKVCMAIESIDCDTKNICEILGHALGKYEKPKEIFLLDKFPETPSGKIDRRRCIESVG
jgi:o-succinylbenzoate---CoA ligase